MIIVSRRRRVLVTLALTLFVIVGAPVVIVGGLYAALWLAQLLYQATR